MNLTLSLQRSATYKGADRCAGDPIRAEVEGRDAGGVVRAEFYVGSQRVAVDNHAPFTHKLAYRHFDRRGRTRVRVRATTLDGRQMTIDRRVRACR